MGETFLLVRIVGASALIGFLVFCIAHVVVVWRKRNANKVGSESVRRNGRRLAWGCVFAGLILMPVSVVLRELTRGEGTITGEGMYIIRTQDEMDVQWLHDGDTTQAGELLARFGSGSRSARMDELRARVERSEAELHMLELLPISPDAELTRRLQSITQERIQAQQELGQTVIALEVAMRDTTAQQFSRKEALARMELTLTERRKDIDRVKLKAGHAGTQLALYQKLASSGSASATEVQNHMKASRDADIELAALLHEVKDLHSEKEELRVQLDKLETGRVNPTAPLRQQMTTLTDRVTRLEAEETVSKDKVKVDFARSQKLRAAEKVQASAKVRELQAALNSVTHEREVFAPFAGTLAYRAASPNATPTRGTLLVLAPEVCFLLTARLTQTDADTVRRGSEVMIELGDDSASRHIPARFHKASALFHEPGFESVQFTCQPPSGLVRRLVEGEKLTVAFTWHPPLQTMWPFQLGLFLLIGGLVGFLFMGWKRFKWSRPSVKAAPVQDRSPELLKAVVGRLVDVRHVIAAEDMQDTPVGSGAMQREAVAELSRTTEAESVVVLLDRLSQISSHRGVGKLEHNSHQHVHRVQTGHSTKGHLSGGANQQKSGRA